MAHDVNAFVVKTPIPGLNLRIHHLDLGGLRIHQIDLLWKSGLRATDSSQLSAAERKITAALAAYWKGRPESLRKLSEITDRGSRFQQSVWKAALSIPSGTSVTYGEIAKRIRKPQAFRAVGQALNKNPWPLLVPCHRVTGAKNQLGGFACGSELKQVLLSFEKNAS